MNSSTFKVNVMVNKHSDGDHLRPSLFSDVTECRFVVYRCFGTHRLSNTGKQLTIYTNTPEQQKASNAAEAQSLKVIYWRT